MTVLTWSCHVCGDDRPDAFISVYQHQRVRNGVRFTENVRYCNDRPACADGATRKHFVK